MDSVDIWIDTTLVILPLYLLGRCPFLCTKLQGEEPYRRELITVRGVQIVDFRSAFRAICRNEAAMNPHLLPFLERTLEQVGSPLCGLEDDEFQGLRPLLIYLQVV
jgi:hypothetical protein